VKAAVVAVAMALAAGCGPRASSQAAGTSDPRACRCASGDPGCCAPSPSPSLSADAVPRFFPSYTKDCASTDLKEVMRDQFNASLSQVSQALFHDRDEGRLDRVADAAGVILGCAKQIDHHRPTSLVETEWMTFDHMLIQLVMNTHALQSAALEDDPEIVVHWYHHVKQSCAACHARFNEE
jgi:hypothetical protein